MNRVEEQKRKRLIAAQRKADEERDALRLTDNLDYESEWYRKGWEAGHTAAWNDCLAHFPPTSPEVTPGKPSQGHDGDCLNWNHSGECATPEYTSEEYREGYQDGFAAAQDIG